jgi:hypothetical protein
MTILKEQQSHKVSNQTIHTVEESPHHQITHDPLNFSSSKLDPIRAPIGSLMAEESFIYSSPSKPKKMNSSQVKPQCSSGMLV